MNLKQYAGVKTGAITSVINKSTAIMSMKLLSVASISILTVACSGSASNVNSLELLPADSMMQGPGLFSGNDGSYNALDSKQSDKVVETKSAPAMSLSTPTTSSLAGKDLQQTSELLDEKIKQSQRNTIELELLKRQVDEKLRSN